MSGAGDEVVEAAVEQVRVLMEEAFAQVAAIHAEVREAVGRIRAEVLDATGVEIIREPPPRVPAVHDVRLGDLAELAVRCHHLLAAVELLSPHVQAGSVRTVGAVAKAAVDLPTAAMAVHYLKQSEFYALDEGGLS